MGVTFAKPGKDTNAKWVKESFVNYLDDYGDAHISLNNFIEFLDAFNIDLGVKKTTDWEAMRRLKAEVTPDKYTLIAKDYFRGCPTILNSEVAALKVAE